MAIGTEIAVDIGSDVVMDGVTGHGLERQVSAKRREISRLRHDMRMQEAQMQTLISRGVDCAPAAAALLTMRVRLARLIAERDGLTGILVYRPPAQAGGD